MLVNVGMAMFFFVLTLAALGVGVYQAVYKRNVPYTISFVGISVIFALMGGYNIWTYYAIQWLMAWE